LHKAALVFCTALCTLFGLSAGARASGTSKFQEPGNLTITYELGIHPGLAGKAPASAHMPDALLSHGFGVQYTYRIIPWLLLGGHIGYSEYSVSENLFLNDNEKPEGVDHRILAFPLAALVAFDVLPDNERVAVLANVRIGYLAYDYQVWWKEGIMQDSASSLLVGGGLELKAWLWRSLAATLGARYDVSAIEINFSRGRGWRYRDPGDPSALYLSLGLGWSL